MDSDIVLITGANSGIGFCAARSLAATHPIVLACRTESKALDAMQRIRAEHPEAELSFVPLDLADLDSVRACAESVGKVDILVNNAGVMALPPMKTAQGFEMQLGTNHLGHFALTGLLLGRVQRVVNLSSLVHWLGSIDFDDLQSEKRYSRWGAYFQSKLANLLFTHGLVRRVEEHGLDVTVVACHPGYAATHLQTAAAELEGRSVTSMVMRLGNTVLAQSAEMGAAPTILAATDPEAKPGDFYGPSYLFESRGPPKKVSSSGKSHDTQLQDRLWKVSEGLTGDWSWPGH